MRKLRFILPVALIALVVSISLTSCEQREDWRFPELGNGGFVKFTEQPFSWEGSDPTDNGDDVPATIVKYHIGEIPAESDFKAFIEDPTGNVALVEYFVKGFFENAPEEAIAWRSTNSFPFDVSFTAADMAGLFGVDVETFQTGDFFEFMSVITTTDGKVYLSKVSGCDPNPCPNQEEDEYPGTHNGGTIDGVVLQGGDTGDNFLLPAVWYRVKYLSAD